MQTELKLKLISHGDRNYTLAGHPTIRAIIRSHGRGRWGYCYRIGYYSECRGALGTAPGEELFTWSRAEAVRIASEALRSAT